jgi:hypothetical protein
MLSKQTACRCCCCCCSTQVLQRGERLEVLVDRTEALSMNAEAFRNQGRTLRRQMWWNNLKVKILIAFLVLVLAVVIFLLACFAGGNNCTKRGNSSGSGSG